MTLQDLAAAHAAGFRTAKPVPHAVFDGLFDPAELDAAVAEMPRRDSAQWTEYVTDDERKLVCSDVERFGPVTTGLVHRLNGGPFIDFLERLTGIEGLVGDPHLQSAGYFDVPNGGFLDVHLDFARHSRLALVRRVNVLLYLNRGWQEEWGGQLELWDDRRSGPRVRVAPQFNRMLVFETPGAWHGHPQPVACPPGHSRKCLAFYYFTSPALGGPVFDSHSVVFGDKVPTGDQLRRVARQWVPPVVANRVRVARGPSGSHGEPGTRPS